MICFDFSNHSPALAFEKVCEILTGGTNGGIAASNGGCSNPLRVKGAEGAKGERGAVSMAFVLAGSGSLEYSDREYES